MCERHEQAAATVTVLVSRLFADGPPKRRVSWPDCQCVHCSQRGPHKDFVLLIADISTLRLQSKMITPFLYLSFLLLFQTSTAILPVDWPALTVSEQSPLQYTGDVMLWTRTNHVLQACCTHEAVLLMMLLQAQWTMHCCVYTGACAFDDSSTDLCSYTCL